MNIIAVDDERPALRLLTDTIEGAAPGNQVRGFANARDVLHYAERNAFDVAFLDIELQGMSGVELARTLKRMNPRINIVFVTGHMEYMNEAFSMYASGYVMKPPTKEKIRQELENLRHPVPQAEGKKRVRVQAFGNFEVFLDGEPMRFQYSKTKELLAYLVDRKGSLCVNGEIISVLWEDSVNLSRRNSHFRNLSSDLVNAFKAAGCGDVIVKQRGKMAVVPDKIDCDYFDWENGDIRGINAYKGEYMAQYSWGEMTHGGIEKQREHL